MSHDKLVVPPADEGTTSQPQIRDLITQWKQPADQSAFGSEVAWLVYNLAREECADQLAAALSPSEGPGGQKTMRASEPSDAGEGQDLRENPDTKGSEQ